MKVQMALFLLLLLPTLICDRRTTWGAESFDSSAPVPSPQFSITVRNPTDESWQDTPIVVPWDDKLQSAFAKNSVAILSPQSAYVQRDDLDGDGETDELVFLLTLKPKETTRITIGRGSASPPAARTDAGFYPKVLIGAAWESDRIAYRLYWNNDTAIDVFAKRNPTLALRQYALPEVDYHVESEWGLDVLKVGTSLGAGGFGVWHDGRVWKPTPVQRSCRILATGPYRSVLETRFTKWRVGTGTGTRELELTATISIAAGQTWSEVELMLKTADEQPLPDLVAGIVKNSQAEKVLVKQSGILGCWGKQALGDHQVPASADLGLGVVVPPDAIAIFGEDDVSSYFRFRPVKGRARYRFHASWEHEPGGARSVKDYQAMLTRIAMLRPEIVRLEWNRMPEQ